MNHKPDIDKLIEETLNSLDGVQRAEPRPFFFTRLQQKLENRNKNLWEILGVFITRPVVAIAGVVLLLILNISLIITKDESSVPGNEQEEPAMAEEYSMGVATIYDYENGNNNE